MIDYKQIYEGMSELEKRQHQYAYKILSGEIISCKWVRLACERSFEDYSKQKTNEFPYYYDSSVGEKFEKLCGKLSHIEGPKAGQPVVLDEWQVWLFSQLLGWKNHNGDNKGYRRFRTFHLEVARGNGKALDINEDILTTKGWKKFGDLTTNDVIFSPDGTQTKIKYVHPIEYNRPVYKITFNDGSEIIADENHLWETNNYNTNKKTKLKSVVDTKSISGTIYRPYGHNKEFNHSIDLIDPLVFDAKNFLIDPYILGYWLGDGTSSAPYITCSIEDQDNLKTESEQRLYYFRNDYKNQLQCSLNFLSMKINGFGQELKECGLINNKHIPEEYKQGSIKQRLELLQGLMDSDGTISKINKGSCEITQKNKTLAYDIMELLYGLGFKPKIYEKTAYCNGKNCGIVYRITFTCYNDFPCFKLPRKKCLLPKRPQKPYHSKRIIISCVPVNTIPVRCITVDRADGMFVVGKSMIVTHNSAVSSILALWGLACDGEGGPQIYSAATDRRQASIVFNGTKRQITNPNHDRLMKYLKLQALNKEIRCGQNGGTYSALSRDASRMDGLNIHFAIVDEIHAHPNSNTWDVLVSGSTKRRQSLMVAITTAGHDLSSFGYVQNEYCRAILEGQGDTRDETFLGVIFCAEEGDDPYSEDAWRKANPCWDSAIDKIKFRSNALKAKAVVSARNEFYTKHLNMWINSGGSWIDGNSLQNCYDPHINENDTYDYKLCGFDLATVNDLCCYVNVFVKIIDGKNHYYIFPHAFIPQRAIDQNFNAKYPIWQSTGELTVMPGEAIDHKEFDRLLIENIKTYEIGITGGDRFMGVHTLQAICEAGFNAYAVKQTTVGMCLGTEEFETAILEGRLHWNNEVFQWNTMNAILEFDKQGMFKPIKEHPKSNKKIDTVHAAISAIICGMDNNFGSSNIEIYN